MIALRQTLIKSCDLAKELGVSVETLCRWSRQDKRFKASKFKKGWYSIARLREHGICVEEPAHA